MHPDSVLMLIIAVAAGAAGPFIAWQRAAARVRSLEARLRPCLNEDARIEQLQSAVDALARHSEQLAEGQDFLGRIVSDRLPPAPLPTRLPAEITPH